MKKFAMIVSILLVAVLSVAMVGCSTYGSVKKAFEDAGYKQSEVVEALAKDIKTATNKEELGLNIHGMIKGAKSVLIFEFNATEDMKKVYDENKIVRDWLKEVSSNEDAKEFYKSLEDLGIAKGNCLVVPVAATISDVKEVMKNA